MSYSVYIVRFENGDSSPISLNEVESIVSKYGEIIKGDFGLEIVSKVGDMFECCSLTEGIENKIEGISFDRPTLHPQLANFIFDLLAINNTCFFDTDMEIIFSRYDISNHCPDYMVENLKIIDIPSAVWPI